MSYQPIGIFDSGVGGLTVLKEVSRILPSEDIIYLGDTARVPYGIRSPETVTRYSFECTEFLLRQDIKLLIVACNTVSAISLKEIREKVFIPVIGVIEPGARAAINSTKNRRIGIIGTEATIKSSAYLKAIKALDKDIEVFGLPCPLFVPLVEEGWTEGIIARLIVERYLKDMMDRGVDTLVLGCTHYPLLKGVIQDAMKGVCLVDSAIETARVVRDVLEEQRAKSKEQRVSGQGRIKFYVTDSTEKFVNVGERFLQSRIEDIEKIQLP
jgi:glutamate racemase